MLHGPVSLAGELVPYDQAAGAPQPGCLGWEGGVALLGRDVWCFRGEKLVLPG